jgi:hypothetical protein
VHAPCRRACSRSTGAPIWGSTAGKRSRLMKSSMPGS